MRTLRIMGTVASRGLEGFSSDALESVLRAANQDLATLVPNARFFVAKDSSHDVHQDQPELVIEAPSGAAATKLMSMCLLFGVAWGNLAAAE